MNGIDSSNKTAEDVTQMLTADMPEYSLTLTERDGSEEKLQGKISDFIMIIRKFIRFRKTKQLSVVYRNFYKGFL